MGVFHFSVNLNISVIHCYWSDHAIEHQNRIMKVLGGIKGIANDINKLDKYFTIAPEINYTRLLRGFRIENYNAKRAEHHELTGNKSQRIKRAET